MTKPTETTVVLPKSAAAATPDARLWRERQNNTAVLPRSATAPTDMTAPCISKSRCAPGAPKSAAAPTDMRATTIRPKARFHFLTALALLTVLSFWLASCSSKASTGSQLGVDETLEPEIGYTGLDVTEAVATALGSNLELATLESPAQDVRYAEDASSSENSLDFSDLPESENQSGSPNTLDPDGQPDSINPVDPADPEEGSAKLFPSLSGAQTAVSEAIYLQDAAAGVMTLKAAGFSSQEICGSQPLINDFALPEEITQAIITPANVAPTAEDVKAAVWEYYEVVAQTFRQPSAQGLLCLAKVATLPKLEWNWQDLKVLASERLEVNFLLPTEVHVVGLLTGSAVAVACLPPLAYGELSADNQAIAASVLLRWAGGRWRVSTTQDFPGENCRDRARFTQQSYESDISDTGEAWILEGF